jgi:hypothetical protein
VRNVWSDMTADSCRFEPAFSADCGKTWEVNRIAVDTRVKDEADRTGNLSSSQDFAGRWIRKVVPNPGALSVSIVQPSRSQIRLTK